MIYLSCLIPDEELSSLLAQYNAGLELIDFSVGMNLDHLQSYLTQWKKRLDILGNPKCTVHGPFLDLNPVSFDSYVAEAAKIRFHQAYEAALALQAGKIIYHTCRIPQVCYLEGWAHSMASFWNDFLKSHTELPVAVENVFDESLDAIAEFASLVEAPNFSLCFDTGHANYASAQPVLEWMKTLAPWITHLHLHDNHGIRDEHLAIGQGCISWDVVFPAISTLPHVDGITLENTSLEDFQISLKKLPGNLL